MEVSRHSNLNLSLGKAALSRYLVHQLNHFFPDANTLTQSEVSPVVEEALERLEHCFKHIQLKYFSDSCGVVFNHLNSDHYAMFLYWVSNTAYKRFANENLATKSFYLNKAMHGVDCFYAVSLPEIFLFVHPVGSVIGNAHFEDYFVVYQNCTIGSTDKGIYPTFSKETVLYSGVSVIGECHIGENVIFGANTKWLNQAVESHSVVLGAHPNNRIVANQKSIKNDIFNDKQPL